MSFFDALEKASQSFKAVGLVGLGIAILILFHDDISNILSRTSTVTISGVVLEIDRSLHDAITPEVGEKLSRLSPDAVTVLVTTGKTRSALTLPSRRT